MTEHWEYFKNNVAMVLGGVVTVSRFWELRALGCPAHVQWLFPAFAAQQKPASPWTSFHE